MNVVRTALLVGALGILAVVDANAQPLPVPRPLQMNLKATWFTVDFDTATVHPGFWGGTTTPDAQVRFIGPTLAFNSDGTTPAKGATFALYVSSTHNDGITACFALANQARLAGGHHTLRIKMRYQTPLILTASEGVTVKDGNIDCEVDP
jgi:hypothetical protein